MAAAVAAVVLAGASRAQAQTPQLDQSFTAPHNLGANINECCAVVAQTFTPGITGTLAGIHVAIFGRSGSTARLKLAIHTVDVSGFPTAVVLGSTTLGSASSLIDQLVPFTGVEVVAGVQYAIVASYVDAPPPGGGQFQGIWSGATGDVYPRGEMLALLGTTWINHGSGGDVHFETFVASNPDGDADGYYAYGADADCDDADPAIHPGAPEIRRDGIDQDCDGSDTILPYRLANDPAGGDCALIGSWDAATSTCTLAADVVQPRAGSAIELGQGPLTLDGAGHSVRSTAARYVLGSGVHVYGAAAGVTLRNLTISGFDRAMFFDYGSHDVTVDGVTVRSCGRGLEARTSSAFTVVNGRFEDTYDGVLFEGGSGYVVRDSSFARMVAGMVIRGNDGVLERNTFTAVQYPIEIVGWIGGDWKEYPASRNHVRDNTFEGGIVDVLLADDNALYHNDFLAGATAQVSHYQGFPSLRNVLDQPLPVGGNFWSGAACSDANGDGICDAPVAVQGGADGLPWTVRSGWRDGDGDGAPSATDCNDRDASIHPGAAEIPYDGVDQNCSGMADDDDLDRDGHLAASDCNDGVASVYPGAPEAKHDGIDQDCNGFDLTIDVVKAIYRSQPDAIRFEATSALGAAAGLQLAGYGPMTWDAASSKWVLNVKAAGGNPGTVTVSGKEGTASAVLTVQ